MDHCEWENASVLIRTFWRKRFVVLFVALPAFATLWVEAMVNSQLEMASSDENK